MDSDTKDYLSPLAIVTGLKTQPKLESLISLRTIIGKEFNDSLKLSSELVAAVSPYQDAVNCFPDFIGELAVTTLISLPPFDMGTIYDQTN